MKEPYVSVWVSGYVSWNSHTHTLTYPHTIFHRGTQKGLAPAQEGRDVQIVGIK